MITITANINVSPKKAWELYTTPSHICRWNFASPDWCCPRAEHLLEPGGFLNYRMEAKDESFGFDFEGIFDSIVPHQKLAYTISDGRKVTLNFEQQDQSNLVTIRFEPETENTEELQQQGWQAILNNFKSYAEKHNFNKLIFEIKIQNSVNRVFHNMLDDEGYRYWTFAFQPTSHYQGEWKKGNTIHFIGFDAEGKRGGMISRIAEFIPNQFVSLEAIGLIEGDTEILEGDKVEPWAGSLENYYYFANEDGSTTLKVTLDSNDEFASYFQDTYPLALERLKEYSER
jgi:uncharacterized protein YndB with AHSA1/START domain